MKLNLIWSNFFTSSWSGLMARGTSLLPHLQIITHKPNSPCKDFPKKERKKRGKKSCFRKSGPLPPCVPEITESKSSRLSPPPSLTHAFISIALQSLYLHTYSVLCHPILWWSLLLNSSSRIPQMWTCCKVPVMKNDLCVYCIWRFFNIKEKEYLCLSLILNTETEMKSSRVETLSAEGLEQCFCIFFAWKEHKKPSVIRWVF